MKKKIIKKQVLNNGGVALFVAILTASIALTIGLGVLGTSLKEIKLSSLGRESMSAFFAADAGLECALYFDDVRTPDSPGSIFGTYGMDGVTDGLVGYWKFDETSGLVASDENGFNDGDLTAMNGDEWETGKIMGALSFDGLGDYIKLGSDPILSPRNGSFSVSFWYKGPITEAASFFSGGTFFGDYWDIRSDLSIFYDFELNRVVNTFYTLEDDAAWHHLVVVLDRNTNPDTLSIYQDNGTPISTTGTLDGGDIVSTQDVKIGSGSWILGSYQSGSIDDFRIYNKALTAIEVNRLFNYTGVVDFTPPENPLPASTYSCASSDLSTDWDVSPTATGAKITFSIQDPCSIVYITKDDENTIIDSRGYNTCDVNAINRVERGIRVSY